MPRSYWRPREAGRRLKTGPNRLRRRVSSAGASSQHVERRDGQHLNIGSGVEALHVREQLGLVRGREQRRRDDQIRRAFGNAVDGGPHRGDDHEVGLHVLAHERGQHADGVWDRLRLRECVALVFPCSGRFPSPPTRRPHTVSARGVPVSQRFVIWLNIRLKDNDLQSYYRAGIGQSLLDAGLCSAQRVGPKSARGANSACRQTRSAHPRCSIRAQVSLRVTVRLKTRRSGVESASTQK